MSPMLSLLPSVLDQHVIKRTRADLAKIKTTTLSDAGFALETKHYSKHHIPVAEQGAM